MGGIIVEPKNVVEIGQNNIKVYSVVPEELYR